MGIWLWIGIIAKLVELIAEGMDRAEALACCACMFNVSEKDILKHWKL